MPFFSPDYLFSSLARLPLDLFPALGVRLLFCDIDNTLVSYDDAEPTPEAERVLSGLRERGVEVVFFSNNTRERVEIFNRAHGLAALPDCHKPFCARAMMRVLRERGLRRESAAVLGDQILTDVLAARFSRLGAILVRPIRDKRTLLFRVKRAVERPILRAFARKWGENSERKPQVARLRAEE